MASGLPDYQRPIRPKFGGGIASAGELLMSAGEINELVSISGKGMIYGGCVYFDYTSTQKASIVKLEVDGEIILGSSFQTLVKYGVTKPRNFPGCLLVYNDVEFVYAVGFSYGLTFETSLKLYYHEIEGTTPTVSYRIIYALI